MLGLSAGATLAVVSALRARDEDGPVLRGQALFYPVTNCPSVLTDSYQTYAKGYGLSQDNMHWFWEQYLPTPAAGVHPYAWPLRADYFAGTGPEAGARASKVNQPLRLWVLWPR